MPTTIHAFSQEEIMAYLDGELSPERALAAAQHLEQCRECQHLAADFQNVSQKLVDWEIEPITSGVPQLATEESKRPKRAFWTRPGPLIAIAVGLFLVVAMPALLFVRPVLKEIKADGSHRRICDTRRAADRPDRKEHASASDRGNLGGRLDKSAPATPAQAAIRNTFGSTYCSNC